MNTYAKILTTTLPLVFAFVFAMVGTTYYFSRMALTDLAETWLATRLSEAMQIAAAQEDILHQYGLEGIPASITKAKMDAGSAMSAIEVGKRGYIFAVDARGIIAMHPDRNLIGSDVSSQAWFRKIKPGQGRFVFLSAGGRNLARHDYFKPWKWVLVATAPETEVYGVANRVGPYVIYLGIACSMVLATALMLLTRRLTQPLRLLTAGADRIGKGDLDTRIPISTQDEFGQLAEVFNRMAAQLQATLTALQRREEHFRSIIENASDMIVILDADGVFLYASPSTERILGYVPQDLIGRTAFEFIHPDDRRNKVEHFRQRVKSAISPTPTEFRFRHSDGSWCMLEGISENLLDHPAVGGFVINARDIHERKLAEAVLNKSYQELEQRVAERTAELTRTNRRLRQEIEERKYAEEALRASEQRMRAILRASPVGIGLVIGRKLNWCNEALHRMVGYEKAALFGSDATQLYPDPEEFARVDKALSDKISKSEIGEVETRMVRSDGTLFDCSFRAYPLNPDDPSRGRIIAVTDITERKRTQEMLMQTEKMVSVGNLAAGMAHEINNPLAGVLQNVQVLGKRLQCDLPANRRVARECGLEMEDVEEYMTRRGLFTTIDLIIESGRRAAQIVGNMLSFSRKSESKFGYHRLDQLLDKTVELAENDYDLKTRFDFRATEITREYADNTPAVQCESSKIQQVFLNIIRNSSQAIAECAKKDRPETPRFIFRVLPEGDRVRVEIEDNGPGIEKAVCKRVFEPFFTTKGVGVGTGLGLSVSYFIITESHGGSMEVASAPGKGARFIIRIPVKRKSSV